MTVIYVELNRQAPMKKPSNGRTGKDYLRADRQAGANKGNSDTKSYEMEPTPNGVICLLMEPGAAGRDEWDHATHIGKTISTPMPAIILRMRIVV